MRRYTTALCIALALLAAACAGRQFVRPEADAFLLGKTTRAEIMKQYGAPDGEFTLVKNGHTVRGMGYRHITMFGRPNIYPERVLRFVFVDDALVGYDYSSSYLEDKTDFEEDRIYRMRKGETTKAQVIDQLGRPGGTYIYPMTGNATDTAIVYRYFRKSHETFKGLRILDKIVVISFDRRDVISGLEVGDVMSGGEVGHGDSRIAGGKGMEVKPEPGTLTSGAPAIPPADAAIGRTPDASTAGPPATAVSAPPTAERSGQTGVVGTWSGMLHGQQRSYPLIITFRNDGTYQATSATLNAGSFDGTWQLSGGNVVWEAVTTGRTGTATVQKADGKSTLRIVPDDRTYTAELTPFDLRTWLAGKWDGSGGGYELTISSNLTWEYTSTVRGRWSAYGTAQIKEPGTVVLEGWFSGTRSYGPPERLIMILHRYDESLSGEFRLSQTWRVSFSRAGRPAKK